MAIGWVSIMRNGPGGVLYTGVTADIGHRTYKHREGLVPGFTKRRWADLCEALNH
jgi:putative endonuclease